MTVKELMERTGVGFGTSGARGLATALTDQVAYVYTRGFLQYLEAGGDLTATCRRVAVAGDLRPSTGRIMEAIGRAAGDAGLIAVDCGRIPSPAVALYGLAHGVPAIMVTGSHIPADRNGIKFNKVTGEILKSDEAGIVAQAVEWSGGLFAADGSFARRAPIGSGQEAAAGRMYVARYLEVFPRDALQGLRLGVYQHSAVGRDILVEVLKGLGAEVIALGRSAEFVPVDTEAIRREDVELAKRWSAEHGLDAVVSTDGDSDRPLISDGRGCWLRGDVAGVLCARYLRADSVSTPVSCNSVVERSGWFAEVRRTRIGSPYVIESMLGAAARGVKRVVGYEANGGFLIQTDLEINGRSLRALPTRDGLILILAILLFARQEGKSVAELVGMLPPRFTASDRLKDFPTERARAILGQFDSGDGAADRHAIERVFPDLGAVGDMDRTDGLRISFGSGEIVHLRPSGNAPEFRCYTEADREERAWELARLCLETLRRLAV